MGGGYCLLIICSSMVGAYSRGGFFEGEGQIRGFAVATWLGDFYFAFSK